MKDKLAKYFRKNVEIKANGIIYRGRLVGADEDFVYMIGPTSWITIPMENMIAIREQGEGEKNWIHKKVEERAEPTEEERESKRRYGNTDLAKLLEPEEPEGEWPLPFEDEDD